MYLKLEMMNGDDYVDFNKLILLITQIRLRVEN